MEESTSSCPKSSSDQELRAEREQEIEKASQSFLKDVVMNMCALEGISGRIDMAFKINRPKILAKVLRNIAKELEIQSEE